jgi:hypothetical protein
MYLIVYVGVYTKSKSSELSPLELGRTRSFFKLEKSINMENKALIISYQTVYSKLLWFIMNS